MIGTRLGPYEITAKLGEGGMGEVYRATDTKLKREVAIKVLPAAFTGDHERLARFEREAQLLAQLHHPNIASIFGLEESGGTHALVMELVEGEDLAAPIARGPLPLDEALPIAKQIAAALDAAHQRGIVHRDLKPANVKLRGDGTVKVLDFGLAKAMDRPPGGAAADSPALMNSPTLTAAGTGVGVILGTAAYMSPEQAKGREVDERTDIWAFGVVLFEMLSGRAAFGADTAVETLSAVLTREVDWSALPASTPGSIRSLLRWAIERNPGNRLHDIADASLVLEDALAGRADEPATPIRGVSTGRRALLGACAVGLLAAGLAIGLAVARRSPAAGPPEFRTLSFRRGAVHTARFTPDGASVLYGAAFESDPVTIFSSRIDASESRALGLGNADVMGIAASGQMALILDRRSAGGWERVGTLATSALDGGTPRPILEQVWDADIAPDGRSFAVVRRSGWSEQLEWPIGTVLYRTEGWLSQPRFSRDGVRIAFADHPHAGDDRGFVTVIGAGKAERLSGDLNNLQGIAWSPDGSEVWASSGDALGFAITAYASGRPARTLWRAPGLLRLQDVGPAGELLLTVDETEVQTQGMLAGDATERPYVWWTNEFVDSIADDGTVFVGTGAASIREGEYFAFARRAGAAPPVRLDPGAGAGISADGKWAFIVTQSANRNRIRLVPIGPGEARAVDLGRVEAQVIGGRSITASRDLGRLAFAGETADEARRGYVVDLAGSKAVRAVSPVGTDFVRLSPDGRWLAAVDGAGTPRIYDADSGAERAVRGAVSGEQPLAWSAANDAVYLWDGQLPAVIQRLDLETGERRVERRLEPRDAAELTYARVILSTDARFHFLRFRRTQSRVVLVRGIR